MMIWNASGVPVWQLAFVWAGVILFWGVCDLGRLRPLHAQALPSLEPPMGSGPRQRPSRRPRRASYRHRLNERHVQYPQCTGGRHVGPPEDGDGPWTYLERPQPHLVLDVILVTHPSAGTADSVTSGSFA